MNKNYNLYNCVFTFEVDSDWIDLEKFVIFRDDWRNPYVVHLKGEGNVLSCLVPDCVLDGDNFKVSVFAGDLLSTNNVTIRLLESGYTDGFYQNCKEKQKDIFVEIFDELDGKVDDVIYDNDKKCFRFYSKGELLKSLLVPVITEEEAETICTNVLNNWIYEVPTATESSDGLLSYEDKIKLDLIKSVAFTGDYSDLNNIPNEFTPKAHNHIMNDVVDYDENISLDLNNMLDFLYDEIRKE